MTERTVIPEWLHSVLKSSATPHDACARLLFHGTIEPFTGRLIASGWEGLRWTAEDPCVAQSYCPESGLLSGWSAPLSYRMSERMLPDGEVNQAIFRDLGFDEKALEAERDHVGRFLSWKVLHDHPTWEDACEHLKGLGYEIKDSCCWVKTKLNGDGTLRLLRADFKTPGRLFILERPEDLRIYDHSGTCDGGLTGRQWMQTDVFKATAASGEWDGIKIDDIHISEQLGHFSHSSIGLFDPALRRLRYHVVDAVSFDPGELWSNPKGAMTPEFDALWSQCQADMPIAA